MVSKNTISDSLIDVLCDITDPLLMRTFLTDVMTPNEIGEISSRLQAAIMLEEGAKYTSIIEATGLSSRTVARISEWLKKDTGGYKTAIATIRNHHTHL